MQLISHTSHISSAQQPCVASRYHTGGTNTEHSHYYNKVLLDGIGSSITKTK